MLLKKICKSFKLILTLQLFRFSEEVFFGLLCIMMALCSISFILLNHLPIAKELYVTENKYKEGITTTENQQEGEGTGFYQSIELEDSSNSLSGSNVIKQDKNIDPSNDNHDEPCSSNIVITNRKKLLKQEYAYLLIIIFALNAMSNGILPSVSSYTALPYGEVPYHLATSLGNMANPLACFVAFFLPMDSYIGIGIMALLSTGMCFVYTKCCMRNKKIFW